MKNFILFIILMAFPVFVNAKTLIVSTPISVTSSDEITSGIHTEVESGGSFAISVAQTLTINGPFSAPLTQVFTGTGAVTGLDYVNPVWFANTQAGNQLAFNAVDTGGVLELTTTRTVTSINVPNAITIKGIGGLSQAIADVASDILTLGADGTIVDGITITGPVTTGNTNHSNVAGIKIQGRSNVTIKNCTITGKQNGIENIEDVTGVTDVNIENNVIRHTGYGIVIWPTNTPAVTTDYGNRIRIVGNDVRLQAGFDATSENVRGIRVSHCDNVDVVGNQVYGQELSIENWTQSINRHALNINFVNNNVDHWMSMDGVSGGVFQGNVVDYLNRPSVYLTSPTYASACGIEVISSQNIAVSKNYIANQTANGIYTGYAGNGPGSYTTSHHLNITDNVIYNCAQTVNYSAGIQLGYVHDIHVANNQINSCGGATLGSYGIAAAGKVTGAFFSPIYNMGFVNNIITDTTVAGANTGAVHIHSVKGLLFSGNVVKNTIGSVANGLSIGAGFTSDAKIIGNILSNNSGNDLALITAGNLREVTLENNTITKCSSGTPGIYMALRYNKGLVNEGNANTQNSFEIGDLYNISHASNKWVRATVAGTFIVGAPISLNSTTATASTTSGSATVTVNKSGALALEPGQYITIAGVTGTKKVLYITYDIDTDTSNATNTGFTGATVVINSTCDATVTDAAISYVAGTMAQVL